MEEIQDAAEQANALQFILKNQFGKNQQLTFFINLFNFIRTGSCQ